MKRVLLVRRAYGFGGAEIRLLDWLSRIDYTKNAVFISNPVDIFSERLTNRGIPATFVSLSEEKSRGLFGVYDPKTGFELGRGSFWQLLKAWWRFLAAVRPNAVVFMEGYFFDFPLGCVLAAFLATRGRVYMTEHSSLYKEVRPRTRKIHWGFVPGLGLWWYRRVLPEVMPWHLRGRLSKRVLCASEGVRDRILKSYRYPAGKMGIIHHGVDTSRFRSSQEGRDNWRATQGVGEQDSILLCTARLSREKGLDKLLAAFQILCQRHDRIWLFLAGDGPLRQDVEKLAAQGEYRRIRLLGHVEDVLETLQGSDIYVLASESEGFGIALIEAMATGLVCVATKSDGPAEIVVDGENGLLARPGLDGLLEGLERALQLSSKQRSEMGKRARDSVIAKYELRTAVEHALELLDIERVPEELISLSPSGQTTRATLQGLTAPSSG